MITGQNLVGGLWESNVSDRIFQTANPKTKEYLSPMFQEATSEQVTLAVEKAAAAFEAYAATSFEQRVELLKAIQDEIKQKKTEIIGTYQVESALPEGRAKGELQRTLDQIERFIELLKDGSFSQATIHTHGPDLRKMLFPMGPIVVFGASNFPLAFSTAGGDTISALAAGCPVIVKAHPYHAGTSELVAQAIHSALKNRGLPLSIFSHLKLLYHNHDFEFTADANGEVVIDYLLEHCDPEFVNFQMDLYWVTKAGADPLVYFEKYPGRFKLWHVKDMDEKGRFAPVGQGTIDFERILAKKERSGMKAYFVEQDVTIHMKPLEAIKVSHEGLKKFGFN